MVLCARQYTKAFFRRLRTFPAFGLGITVFAGRSACYLKSIIRMATLAACWAGTLYFLAKAFFDKRRSSWWGIGICGGLGLLSKYTIVLLAPASLLFMAIDPMSRQWLKKKEPYLAAILALLIFSPVIVWKCLAKLTTSVPRKHMQLMRL